MSKVGKWESGKVKELTPSNSMGLELQIYFVFIFRSIEASAIGTPSEDDLRGLFSDFSVDSAALGSTVIQLPANLFFGVGIATCIIVLKKSAKIDAITKELGE